MRILRGECVDRRFAQEITGHEVVTVRQVGWASIKNGELLTLAQEQFDVFVTVDWNLSFQQNLSQFTIAVVVLQAPTNQLKDLRLLVPNNAPSLALSVGSTERSRPKPDRCGDAAASDGCAAASRWPLSRSRPVQN